MCLILFAWNSVPGAQLIVAANRDEWFGRPAEPAAFWTDRPTIMAGRDKQAGGTWLGVARSGRFAAVTNYRNPNERRTGTPSRGELVASFLDGTESAESYVRALHQRAQEYNGFSLLAADGEQMFFCSNYADAWSEVPPGVHGLSNHLLDTPWPKVVKGTAGLSELIIQPFAPGPYLALMDDSVPATERDLANTGVDAASERRLSSLRILAGDYGTRCTSVLSIPAAEEALGEVDFTERTYNRDGATAGEVRHRFKRRAGT